LAAETSRAFSSAANKLNQRISGRNWRQRAGDRGVRSGRRDLQPRTKPARISRAIRLGAALNSDFRMKLSLKVLYLSARCRF